MGCKVTPKTDDPSRLEQVYMIHVPEYVTKKVFATLRKELSDPNSTHRLRSMYQNKLLEISHTGHAEPWTVSGVIKVAVGAGVLAYIGAGIYNSLFNVHWTQL